MPKNLNNLTAIKQLDSQDMLGSLGLLAKQMQSTRELSKNLIIPVSYKKVNKILVAGMGGSEINWHVVKTLFFKELRLPVEIISDYHLPNWVDKNTLVIGSSYSGGTEETVNVVKEALQRHFKVLILTSGGELEKIAKVNKLPILLFNEDNNPCHQPRIGIGYMVMGAIVIFKKLGFLPITEKQIDSLIKTANQYGQKFSAEKKENLAKSLAQKMAGKTVWYVSAAHLSGNVHVGANQTNENAKRFAGYFLIPELNHHLLEGLINPKNNKDNLLFVLLESNLYDAKVKKRFDITKKVLEKNKIEFFSYNCQEETKAGQVIECLAFTGHASFYGAILEDIDPSAIPFVDYFKAQMKK